MSPEFLAQIEAYLEGQISKSELEQLAKPEGITQLDEKIEWFKNSRIAIESAGLRNQLKEILPKPAQQTATIRTIGRFRSIAAIAASVLVIILVYWGMNSGDTAAPYAKYQYVDPGLPVLMSQSKDHLLYDAMTYYSEENYEVAATKLRQLQAQKLESDTVSYYLGASLLYEGQAAAASETLSPVAALANSTFKQRAEWLLVLAALKEGELEQVKQLLPVILAESEHQFYGLAEQLQAELD